MTPDAFDEWFKRQEQMGFVVHEMSARIGWNAAIAHMAEKGKYVAPGAEVRAFQQGEAAERERCARVAVFRSCSWTEQDDAQSDDYRRGIEDAASQIAARIREG